MDCDKPFGRASGKGHLAQCRPRKGEIADLRIALQARDRGIQADHLQSARLTHRANEQFKIDRWAAGIRRGIEFKPYDGGLARSRDDQFLVRAGPGHSTRRTIAEEALRDGNRRGKGDGP